MNAPRRSRARFRALLAALTALAWAAAIALAAQASEDPAVLGRYSRGAFALVLATCGLAVALSGAHLPSLYERLFRNRLGLLLLAGSTVLALVLAEAVVRIVDPGGISYLSESTRYQLDRLPDDELVFVHRPGFRATYYGVDVSFNEVGFRDRPVPPPGPEEFRILLVGDSVTFGSGVRAEDTFGRQLESSLRRSGRPVRTINIGVGGYNSEQELGALRRWSDVVRPDLVLLLYVPNDVEPTPGGFASRGLRRLNIRGTAVELLQRSWIYQMFVVQRRYGGGPPREPAAGPHPSWDASMSAVRAMAEHCRERGIPFLVFFFRMGTGRQALFQSVGEVARSEGFPFVDTSPWFEDVDRPALRNSKIDSHPNAGGHAVLAGGIEEFLVGEALVP